jgi:hypothetical protein
MGAQIDGGSYRHAVGRSGLKIGTIPVLKAKEVVRLLGFFEVRQRGSHKQFRQTEERSDNGSGIKNLISRH